MATTIIVDYGMGNLRSVQKAFEKIGHEARISRSVTEITSAHRLVLPGVGAFRDAAASLRKNGISEAIKDHIAADRPFLGICLGLQLLMEVSFEDGEHAGLGVVRGGVRRFDLPSGYKIPHMGWNRAELSVGPAHRLLQLPQSDPWFYFVHSYHVVPDDPSWVAATTDYFQPFVSVIARGNLIATQFHPEKSQHSGMHLLKNFVSLADSSDSPS